MHHESSEETGFPFRPIFYDMCIFGCSCVCISDGTRGQGKHGFAVHTRGAFSFSCCGESPRALGQKVPAGDRKALAMMPAVKLHVEPRHLARASRSSTGMP
ncbi:unnamed protein product [Polarella glacialis]|uniref:Uncharacterized protein n=1 Tax=Polarella glacialis TaxID=89957 RepID=A0A813EE31_POLGL|nr:unnamed protein product [Polarella glacialis]